MAVNAKAIREAAIIVQQKVESYNVKIKINKAVLR
jgi:hypothetical protein